MSLRIADGPDILLVVLLGVGNLLALRVWLWLREGVAGQPGGLGNRVGP